MHAAFCYCPDDHTGNPDTACYLSMIIFGMITFARINFLSLVSPATVAPITAGCDNNDECPGHTACQNRLCVNPCAYDDPCSENAFCQVINHSPVCTCPDGYIGDPTIECKLRN